MCPTANADLQVPTRSFLLMGLRPRQSVPSHKRDRTCCLDVAYGSASANFLVFRGFNNPPHRIVVYASHPPLPATNATLTTGPPATAYRTGLPPAGSRQLSWRTSNPESFAEPGLRVHRISQPTSVTIAKRPLLWVRDGRENRFDLPDNVIARTCDRLARRAICAMTRMHQLPLPIKQRRTELEHVFFGYAPGLQDGIRKPPGMRSNTTRPRQLLLSTLAHARATSASHPLQWGSRSQLRKNNRMHSLPTTTR